MAIETTLTKHLGIANPIIQAPLAGGGDTPELVAAVCNAGGLGFIGAAYLTPAQISEVGRAVRERTARRFGINLFAPLAVPELPSNTRPALDRVAPFFAELGLPAPSIPESPGDTFAGQLAAALETEASLFSFTLGLLPASAIEGIKRRGMFLIGTATTVAEAIALEKSRVDAVVAQGSEAGGHRGSFAERDTDKFSDCESGMIGTVSLVPQIVDAVKVPVIASGGIMDGRGVAAAITLGAGAVQMGTAFLTCREAGVPEIYKEAILAAREDQTRITRAFSGRPARGIVNRFLSEVESGEEPNSILPFPLQNILTRPLRTAAAKQGRAEFLSLWAGQGVRLARRQSAAELIVRIVGETEDVIRGLKGQVHTC